MNWSGTDDSSCKINRLAEKLVECAIEDKQGWAFQQIADRLEGKPVQVVDATVDDNRADLREYTDAELTAMLRGKVKLVEIDGGAACSPDDETLN